MSTYNCPRCDKKISLKADTCPHCGESLLEIKVDTNSTGDGIKDVGMIILSLSIFALMAVAVTKKQIVAFVFLSIFLTGLVIFIIGHLINMRR